jgi:hypothetical protein
MESLQMFRNQTIKSAKKNLQMTKNLSRRKNKPIAKNLEENNLINRIIKKKNLLVKAMMKKIQSHKPILTKTE